MKITLTQDADIIARLNQPVQELHHTLSPENFNPYCFDDIKDFFNRIIQKPEHLFLLIEEEKLFGYAWIEIKKSPKNPFKKAYTSIYVHQIGVLDSYRNKGCGSMLLEKIDQIAVEHGASEVQLDYWTQNGEAKKFYKNKGFKVYRESVHKLITTSETAKNK
ncbi:GNAT family N-acetyltransferase [Bacillus gobiensis]|uniref:GNAT family N-acetyltransferase n=1 Tax=Bacillus gobiensis TaxID=1441095 RepID=UPI003D259636